MLIYARVTDKIYSGEFPIEYIDYLRIDDFVNVMVSHSATWEMSGVRVVDWNIIKQEHPIPDIDFQDGFHLLKLDFASKQWREIIQ